MPRQDAHGLGRTSWLRVTFARMFSVLALPAQGALDRSARLLRSIVSTLAATMTMRDHAILHGRDRDPSRTGEACTKAAYTRGRTAWYRAACRDVTGDAVMPPGGQAPGYPNGMKASLILAWIMPRKGSCAGASLHANAGPLPPG